MANVLAESISVSIVLFMPIDALQWTPGLAQAIFAYLSPYLFDHFIFFLK
jgi:hypothetical protein